jgi:hypothetical protein
MTRATVSPTPAPDGDEETLEQMLELLRTAASIRAPDRQMAVRYTQARARLVSGRLGPFVPPFLIQCASVFTFLEFIRLFAPDAPRRIAFVEECFEPCRRAAGFKRGYDIFGEQG